MSAQQDPERLRTLLSETDQRSVTRSCFLLHIRPECLADYVEAHQHVWPDMRAALSRAGWRNYSLFLDPRTATVVGYFESDDVDAARAAMSSLETNTRWQRAMAEYFLPPDGGRDQILPQYFYLP
jgi:L-rhamnose mutarotase